MQRRGVCVGLGLIAFLAEGCAASGATTSESASNSAVANFIADIDAAPRREGEVAYSSYAFFIATDASGAPSPTGAMAGAFARFSSAILGENFGRFVGDATTASLDVVAGRAALDRVNRDYGLSLQYAGGPYLVVLRRHPSDPPAAAERAIVMQFSGRSGDDIASALNELTASMARMQARSPSGRQWSWTEWWHGVFVGFSGGEAVVSGPDEH